MRSNNRLASYGGDRCAWVAALILAVTAGCGAGSNSAPVRGHVTYQGKPVTTGSIMFHPDEGRSSAGVILEDGSYELEGEAVVGKHTVTIEAFETTGDQPMASSYEQELKQGLASPAAGPPKIKWHVPQDYASKASSQLTAEVTPGKTNTIDFDF